MNNMPQKPEPQEKIEKSATKRAKNWAPNLCFYNSSTKPKQAKKQQQRHENSNIRKKKKKSSFKTNFIIISCIYHQDQSGN